MNASGLNHNFNNNSILKKLKKQFQILRKELRVLNAQEQQTIKSIYKLSKEILNLIIYLKG